MVQCQLEIQFNWRKIPHIFSEYLERLLHTHTPLISQRQGRPEARVLGRSGRKILTIVRIETSELFKEYQGLFLSPEKMMYLLVKWWDCNLEALQITFSEELPTCTLPDFSPVNQCNFRSVHLPILL